MQIGVPMLVSVIVHVRALGPDIWMIRYGSSFHQRLPAIFLSRLL